jgi:transposase
MSRRAADRVARRALAREAVAAGRDARALAARLGCGVDSARRWCRRLGVALDDTRGRPRLPTK